MKGPTLYDRVGGMPFFEEIVGRFYAGVTSDPVLAPLYPPGDMDGARRRLMLFLVQFWGGPTTYLEERGHPRLRARHSLFVIGNVQRDHWLKHMRAALEASAAGPVERAELDAYMETAADAMRNVDPPAEP